MVCTADYRARSCEVICQDEYEELGSNARSFFRIPISLALQYGQIVIGFITVKLGHPGVALSDVQLLPDNGLRAPQLKLPALVTPVSIKCCRQSTKTNL